MSSPHRISVASDLPMRRRASSIPFDFQPLPILVIMETSRSWPSGVKFQHILRIVYPLLNLRERRESSVVDTAVDNRELGSLNSGEIRHCSPPSVPSALEPGASSWACGLPRLRLLCIYYRDICEIFKTYGQMILTECRIKFPPGRQGDPRRCPPQASPGALPARSLPSGPRSGRKHGVRRSCRAQHAGVLPTSPTPARA